MLWMTFPSISSGKNFTVETIVRAAAFCPIHHRTGLRGVRLSATGGARVAICWCDRCYKLPVLHCYLLVLHTAGATGASGFLSCVSSSFRLLS